MTGLQNLPLKPEVSMIEVMRRFRAQPEARVLRARHSKGRDGSVGYWNVQFIGPMPDVSDLVMEIPA